MSSNPPSSTPTTKQPSSSLSPLDSPSSYLNASKQTKAAIKAAYSEIFRIPKKKRRNSSEDADDAGGSAVKKKKEEEKEAPPAKKKSKKNVEKEQEAMPVKNEGKAELKDGEEDQTSILRKGDLVRLDSEQTRSGRIQGGLARVTKVHPPSNNSEDTSDYCYDIEYVLGGKVPSVSRDELLYTTAEAEGLVSTNLRERRSNRSAAKEEADETKKSPPTTKRKRDYANRRPSSRDGSVSSKGSRARNPTAKKAGKETPKVAQKRNSKRNSTDDDSSDANTTTTNNNDSRAMDMYTRHKRELERCLTRLEKVDRFGFFFDTCPAAFDEDYDNMGEEIIFPDGPPFNFVVLKKRLEAGRYDLDFVQIEVERRKEIRDTLNVDKNLSEAAMQTIKEEADVMDVEAAGEKEETESNSNDADTKLYNEIAKTMCHPIGVDWDTFNSDVLGMCDAAMKRDPKGVELGSGHLGWAANKIKKTMDEMYTNYGCKRRSEMEASEARLKFENILHNCGNMEAAMQGKWRKHAFPERKYERLESTSVVCDGLSEMDKSYAIYELGTSIPDSFVGLAYTYDDSGQHSETWMKTVVTETTAKPRTRRKKKGADENADPAESNKDKEHTAAAALAKDDGVIKAQVQNTMQALLIQVQDRVMTDLGVMNQPEARSANWDDGDDRRNYRGGAAEVEQGSNFMTLPEVAEQEVWGVDCYTRKNVMALIEAEFSAEIAVEFMEKWLLPAINACPVDIAYNISSAARILEGEGLQSVTSDAEEKGNSEANEESGTQGNPLKEQSNIGQTDGVQTGSPRRKAPESSVFLRTALESKIKNSGPTWLKAAARLIRLAADSLDEDDGYFRIHPKGHGSVVIAEHGLKANSLVTYYRGEVYPAWRWCEKLDAIEMTQKDLDLRPNLPDFYNMAMERPKKDPRGYGMLFVDASRKSGLGSSFSHSCNPSCEVRVVALNGKLSLAMTTLRDLEQGEELTFDYNAVTESVNEYRFAICLCGHRNCRGSFLHLTSAPCYQQVLSRNCPIAARFANLVRGCMKQVMSREDSDILLKHGFNTAAFGAVSFNHHSKTNTPAPTNSNTKCDQDARAQLGELLLELSSSPPKPSTLEPLASQSSPTAIIPASCSNNVIPDSSEDSIENVPIWLRTYVADTLRYIEYERRALPVALLCNQMERIEQQKEKQKKDKRAKEKKPDKAVPDIAETNPEKPTKPVSGSKPTSSYFFYLNSNRDLFTSEVEKEHGEELKGLALSQAVNKHGSKSWSNLSEEEKQSWKNKSIADWKKNGGKEKAKLEEERQRTNGSKCLKSDSNSSENKENTPSCSNDVILEQKEISFADAEAEGLSAMEQRIQQLAQSLSRVGRVLDRHRESQYREMKSKGTAVNSEILKSLVPTPLKIMSDDEVVNWIWNDSRGVVQNLFAMVDQHFPKKSLLRKLLSNTRATYPVLSAFTAFSDPVMHSSVEPKKGKNSCSSEDARRLVRDGLLEFRSDINQFVAFAENSHFESIKKKKNDADRRRSAEKKAKKNAKLKQSMEKLDVGEETVCSEDVTSNDSKAGDVPIPPHVSESHPTEDFDRMEEMSIEESHDISDDVMHIRGGGDSEPNSSANVLPIESQIQPLSVTVSVHNTSETLSSGDDGLAKLDTRPEILVQDKKSVITPSSTQAGVVKCEEQATSSTPAQEDPTISNQKICAEQTADRNDAIAALALMADLAAAAPLAVEPKQLNCGAPPSITQDLGQPETLSQHPMVVSEITSTIPSHEMDQQQIPNATSPPCPEPEQEPRKKKTVPMNQEQLAYLKKWLLDPNHILNPYPTEAEKTKIMNDIGVEQNHLERWLSRHRKTVILTPEKQRIKMKWDEADSSHWSTYRLQRYMLEATADLLLMYAYTNTFFLLEPFNRFDSTPIEVYARELGNEVPRHLAMKHKEAPGTFDGGNTSSDTQVLSSKSKLLSDSTQDYCSPEDVITSVTLSYSEEYVISQLLQWFNGGIGQAQGLPDIFGCVMLPPVSGCWDGVEGHVEIKTPTYTRNNPITHTEYSTKTRLRLAEWIDDRTKRGSPWSEDLARYFCKSGSSPDPLMPMGSPIIDYLVTGIEENIQFVSSALRNKDGKGIDSPERARYKASASDRLQSTVDAGMPAQAVANWVQCENPSCLKWRKLPWHVDIDLLPEKFFCKDNIWTSGKRSCDVPEDKWDMSDAPVKFDMLEEDFVVGVWFDVQREGKVGYHEAQVMEIDLTSPVKRVKFHFWRLSNASDEWVEIGSPRIAPHHSYTPRPVEGYGVAKKHKRKGTDKTSKSGLTAAKNTSLDAKKRKLEDILPGTTQTAENIDSPKKHEPVEDKVVLPLTVLSSEHPKSSESAKTSEPTKPEPTKSTTSSKKFVPFPKSTLDYLNNWFSQHASYPFPTPEEKLVIMSSTGLNKRQLSDWLSKARKKQKQQAEAGAATLCWKKGGKTSSTNKESDILTQEDANSENLEDLLLQLKGTVPLRTQSDGVKSEANNNGSNCPADKTNPEMILGITESSTPAKSLVPGNSDSPSKSNSVGLSNDAKRYLWTWLREHQSNPFPSREEKEKMMNDLGLEPGDVRKLEGWFSRTRKKLKDKTKEAALQSDTIQPSEPHKQSPGEVLLDIDGAQVDVDGKQVPGTTPVYKPTSADVDAYLHEWMARPENKSNLNPNQETRDKMREESGIETRRIESWFYRLRKKLKKQQAAVNGTQSALTAPTSVANLSSMSGSNPIKLPSAASEVISVSVSTGNHTNAAGSNTNPIVLPPALSNTASSSATQPMVRVNNATQDQNVNSKSTGSSNLDLLFEAASIHSAAKEANSRIKTEVKVSQNNSSYYNNHEHNQPHQRPAHLMSSTSFDGNSIPPEGAPRYMQGGRMRMSPVYCQPTQNRSAPPHGHTPSSNYNSYTAYHDRRPSSGFVPIHSSLADSENNDQQYRTARGPTPTFTNYHHVHPAYRTNDPIRHDDSYHRSSPTYIPRNVSNHPARYPHPPNDHPPAYHREGYHPENVPYRTQYPVRYNTMHNGQQNESHPR